MLLDLFSEFSIIVLILLVFPMLLLCAVFFTQLIALMALKMQWRRDGQAVSAGQIKDARHKLRVTAALMAIFPAAFFVIGVLNMVGSFDGRPPIPALLHSSLFTPFQLLLTVQFYAAPACFLTYGAGFLIKSWQRKKAPDTVREEEFSAAKYKFFASCILLLITLLVYGALLIWALTHAFIPDTPPGF